MANINKIISVVDEAVKVLRVGRNIALIEKWEKYTTTNIRLFNKMLKNCDCVGEKLRIECGLSKLVGHRTLLKSLVPIRGGAVGRKKPSVKWCDVRSAFATRIRTGVVINLTHLDPLNFLMDAEGLVRRRATNALKSYDFIKIYLVLCGVFIKKTAGKVVEDYKYLYTKTFTINRYTCLIEWYQGVVGSLMSKLEEFQEKDSGWALKSITNLGVNISKYVPQMGTSYIQLPRHIMLKKACVNVQNEDNMCFAWAVVSALHPADGNMAKRTSAYPNPHTVLNLNKIVFPMTFAQIPRFEKQNNISVNVYSLDNKKVVPAYLTNSKQDRHVNLLLVEDDNNSHYVWIKNLSRLIRSQLTKHNDSIHVCDRCLRYFYSAQKLSVHSEECEQFNDYKVEFPTDGAIHFKNYKNTLKCPFTIYADIESILKPSKNPGVESEHEAHSVAYYFKCAYDDSLSFFKTYRGADCTKWFVRELQDISENTTTVFECPYDMDPLTPLQISSFNAATHCHICKKPFNGDVKVRDHSHINGFYRGPAHSQCNIEFQDSKTIPVVFHNLSGYDSHFIIKDLMCEVVGDVNLIPTNTENYISFTKTMNDSEVKFEFIDSFRFMASSLDKLASYIPAKPIVRSQFPECTDDNIALLGRKGVFPYEFLNSWDRLEDTSLPPKDAFYSSLTDSNISDSDYEHAQRVWDEFGIETLGEYSDLYLKTDVLLLADVFENFRDTCMRYYGLDPAHYYTAPGYSWEAMLHYTNVTLEYIQDVDILMFLERGIRGGVTQCSKRYAEANNKYMPTYDHTKPSTYLMYYDINAMYSWAMMQFLPTGNLKWSTNIDYNIADDSPTGYIFEVDLEYPQEIHDLQSDLPMGATCKAPPGAKDKKLIADLEPKTKYVIHYRALKQFVKHGIKITQIHRVLEFDQSPWLEPYITLNANFRKAARNEFEKNLFKLLCNAIFGKTMENVRNRRIIRLLGKWEGRYGAESLISKPNFHRLTIFDENFIAVEMSKTSVYFNKPIYAGMSILDISKTLLYEFHYEHMKPNFECNVCYTDTDSLIYEITTKDVYEDMKDHIDRFDTSDYPADNTYGMPLVNKKVPGLMKDENKGVIMTHFVGLRAKMYSCKTLDGGMVKKAKGVKGYVVKKSIDFDDYVDCLNSHTSMEHPQTTIRSVNHRVRTITSNKISLSPHDNKRYLILNTYNTLPWAHYKINV